VSSITIPLDDASAWMPPTGWSMVIFESYAGKCLLVHGAQIPEQAVHLV
jgi:hypothetical protein